MECSLCQSPLADGATVCGACGAAVVADVAEVTTLAGWRGPDTVGGPPRGEVLSERWEIEERLSSDVLVSRYRAHDQETEAQVVLTLIAPGIVPSAHERDALRDRLAAAVGVGNKFLPGLLDADREGQFVFTVEPLTVGMSLRNVLDARRARGETMHVSEVLPVVAQLAAGLTGLAPPQRHGDVRAERVIVGQDGLRLVGAFVVAALPASSVAKALASDDAWRRVLAPEALRGTANDAADRFGVGAIAFEALTGRLPGHLEPLLGGDFSPVNEALRALLTPDPGTRARSLDALIEALAECAHLPVPELNPASFRRLRRSSAPRPPAATPANADSTERMQALDANGELAPATLPPAYRLDDGETLAEDALRTRRVIALSAEAADEVATAIPANTPPRPAPSGGSTASKSNPPTSRAVAAAPRSNPPPPRSVPPTHRSGPPAPTPRPIAGAAVGGTQELAMEDILDTVPARKKRNDESLDPRLVRAALGVSMDEPESVATAPAPEPAPPPKKKRGDDSLDPRLVRAALGVALEESADPDEPATGERPAAPARATQPSGSTQQLTANDLAEMAAAASRRGARITSDTAPPGARRKRDAEPARVVKIPRYDVAKPVAAPPSQPAAPVAAPRPVPPPRSISPAAPMAAPRSVPPPRMERASSVRPPAPAPAAPPKAPRAAQRAPVAMAEDLAPRAVHAPDGRLIIWLSLVLALVILAVGAAIAWSQHAASTEARERRLDQRFQQLQQRP